MATWWGLKREFLLLFLLGRCLGVVRREHVCVEHVRSGRDDSSVACLAVDPRADCGYEEGHEDVQVLPVGVGVCVEGAASVDQEVGRADVVEAMLVNERLVDQVVALIGWVDSDGGHGGLGLMLVVRGNPRMRL